MQGTRRTPEEKHFKKLEAELARCDSEQRSRQLFTEIKRSGLWRRAYETWAEYLEKRWDIYQ